MAPLIRILLRYLTMPLLAIGLILPHEQQEIIGDPAIVSFVSTALGMIAPMIAEGWWMLARRFGWNR